jgi:hypothetical protein
MIITIQAGTASISTRDRNAAAVRSLSAMGSRRMPSLVTWFRRRAKVAVEVVGQHRHPEDRHAQRQAHVRARAREQHDHEHRDQEDAEDGEGVGEVHPGGLRS